MIISFRFKPKKTFESILFIAAGAPIPDVYHTLKILYFADIDHLKKYGRTITGDSYTALEYGPVPANAYDIINFIRNKKLFCIIPDAKESLTFNDSNSHIYNKRVPNKRVLSESEINCLNKAIEKYGSISFNELKEASHDSSYYSVEPGGMIPIENIVGSFKNGKALLEQLRGE